jgi:hypothetical protein
MPDLFHYTCHHGHAAIGDTGLLLPAIRLVRDGKRMPWTGHVIWLTDLRIPIRDALGWTSNLIHCDRTTHRYQVTDDSDAYPWTMFARRLPRTMRDAVEQTPGARPAHWWIATQPIPVRYAPTDRNWSPPMTHPTPCQPHRITHARHASHPASATHTEPHAQPQCQPQWTNERTNVLTEKPKT